MSYEEYKKTVEKKSSILSRREKVAICIKCCERLAPLYSKFSETENWGDEKILSESRRIARAWLQGSNVDFSLILGVLDSAIPDSEDFGSALGSYAQNASISHSYMLDQINTEDMQPLLWVLEKCYDSIDLYVQELLDPNGKGNLPATQIENHEMMITEMTWQKDQLSKVKDQPDLTGFVVEDKNEPIFNVA